ELADERLQRDAVLQADRDRDAERVHDAGQGRALLAELEEDLAQGAVVVGAGGHVALGATDAEARRDRLTRLRQATTDRLLDDDRLDLGLGRGGLAGGLVLRLLRRQRLTHLAVVAVDGERLQAELP